MKNKILLLWISFLFALAAHAQWYQFTTDKVNIRESAVNGKVVSTASQGDYFNVCTREDGWAGGWYEGKWGYASLQYLQEATLGGGAFSLSKLGGYIGSGGGGWSYSFADLSVKDGYVILDITDWSEPNEFGNRISDHHHYIGKPSGSAVHFSFKPEYSPCGSMYSADHVGRLCNQSVSEGISLDAYFDAEGGFSIPALGYDFQPQELKGLKDAPSVTARDYFSLRGRVKEMAWYRSYPESFYRENSGLEDLRSVMRRFMHAFGFSPTGELTMSVAYDVDNKPLNVCSISYEENAANVTRYDANFSETGKETYTLERFNYEFSWFDSSDICIKACPFDANGRTWGCGWSEECFPFFSPYSGEGGDTFFYGDNTVNPTHIQMCIFPNEMDEWFFNTKVCDQKTDSQGNWTERRLVDEKGREICVEKRQIKYYQ